MFETSMDRRAFLRRSGAGVSTLALPALLQACGGGGEASGGGGQSQELTVVSYGGDYQKAQTQAYWDPYLKAHPNASIHQDSPSDNAKIKAMAESGNVTWDLALVDDSFGLDSDGQWLEPIDYKMIDKRQFLPGYAMKYRLGADVEATVLAYRTDKFSGSAPSGLADYFDNEAFPGKRAAWKYAAGGIFEAALIADGVSRDQLYPIDVDRALKKLDMIRGDLVWWTEGAQSQQLLSSGETPLALVWTGRAVDAAEGGAPVKVQWAQWLSQNGWWVIPKGAPHKDFTMELLKYQTSPKAQARLTKLLPYGPTNKGALDKVSPKYKEDLPTSHLDSKITLDPGWWGKNYDAVDKQFQAWLLG
jgi:putative spermidine/putrescine transport system substrate-binding protein